MRASDMHLLVRLLVKIHGRYTVGDKTIILQTAHIFAFALKYRITK